MLYQHVIACLKHMSSKESCRKPAIRVTGSCQADMKARMQMETKGPGLVSEGASTFTGQKKSEGQIAIINQIAKTPVSSN